MEARWRAFRRDPAAFFGEAVWIPSPLRSDEGRVLLGLFDYQHEDLETFLSERFVVVLKARQLGLTTLAMAVALWELLFKPGSNILLVSKDQRTADTALSLLDFMLDFLPPWVRFRAPKLTTNSAREKVFTFGDGMTSRIVSLPATKTAGAGETATRVLWDEAGLAQEQDDTFRSLMPTTDAGGSFVLFSTARGAMNRFAKVVREAHGGESRWDLMFHPWYVSRLMNPLADKVASCPNGQCDECVDYTHYEAKKREFVDKPWLFYSEYPSSVEEALKESGHSRFPGLPPEEDFEAFPWRGRIEENPDGTPRLVEDRWGPLRLTEAGLDPPHNVRCALSIDPATGQGLDATAMSVGWLDHDGTPVRAGFWHDNMIEPVEAARQAVLLGYHFNRAMIAVEKQGGYGDTMLHEIVDVAGYPNVYAHTYTGSRRRKQQTVFGFPMSYAKRPLVIDTLAQYVPNEEDPDRATIDGIDSMLRTELGAFVIRDDGRYTADVGMHDDLVMSTGIWLYVLLQEVGAAKAAPNSEPGSTEQRYDLSYIFDRVDRKIAADKRKAASRRAKYRTAARRRQSSRARH